MRRSIIRRRPLWSAPKSEILHHEYLFAKQDRANIEDNELAEFRKLAKLYSGLTIQQVNQLIRENDWMQICNGD